MYSNKICIIIILFYGLTTTVNSQANCPNCKNGCDESSSCINSECVVGYFGNKCEKKTPTPNLPTFVYSLNPCQVTVSISTAIDSTYYPNTYFLLYKEGRFDKNDTTGYLNQNTPYANLSEVKMTAPLTNNSLYTFKVYFTFGTVEFYGFFNSATTDPVYASCSNMTVIRATTIATTTTKRLSTTSPVTISSTSVITSSSTHTTSVSSTSRASSSSATSSSSTVSTQSIITSTIPDSRVTSTSNTPVTSTTPSTTTSSKSNIVPTVATLSQITTTTSLFNLPPPNISDIKDNVCTVKFPEVPFNSIGIDFYALVIVETSKIGTLSRRKRAFENCQPPWPVPSVPTNGQYRYINSLRPTQLMIFGNNTSLGSNCTNGILNPSTNYTIYAIIGNTNSRLSAVSATSFNTTNFLIWFIPLIVLLLLLLILIIILLIFFLRKKNDKRLPYLLPLKKEMDTPKSFRYWTCIHDRMEARRVTLDQTPFTGVAYKTEYKQLPSPSTMGNILARLEFATLGTIKSAVLDNSRVALARPDFMHQNSMTSPEKILKLSDIYYEGSYIDGYYNKRAFIATGHPMLNEEILRDFWWMVSQENVGQIVMLNSNGDHDSHVYWPTEIYKNEDLEVRFHSESLYTNFTIRKFYILVYNGGHNASSCVVTQYEYKGRIKNGIPENMISFLEFHELIRSQSKQIYGPMIVHSIDESLNTIFIAFYNLYEQLVKENEINVYRTVAHLIRCRQTIHLSVNQYFYIYDMLFESYLAMDFYINKKKYDQQRVDMISKDGILFDGLKYYKLNYPDIVNNNRYRSTFDSVYFLDIIEILSVTDMIYEDVWYKVFQNELQVVVDLVNTEYDKIIYLVATMRYQVQILSHSDSTDPQSSKGICYYSEVNVMVRDINSNKTMNVVIYYFPISLKSYHISMNGGGRMINMRGGDDNENNNNNLMQTIKYWQKLISKLDKNHPSHGVLMVTDDFNFAVSFVNCLNAYATYRNFQYVNIYYVLGNMLNKNSLINQNQCNLLMQFIDNYIMHSIRFSSDTVNRSLNHSSELSIGAFRHSLNIREMEDMYNQLERADVKIEPSDDSIILH